MDAISRTTSGPAKALIGVCALSLASLATALVSSIASTVAERRSSSNSASSPKMSQGPNVASVSVRPSVCVRNARARPSRTT